jgi:ATP-dependent helicase/nuclease subunit A
MSPPEGIPGPGGPAVEADEAARAASLDTARSILLQAPAGSGKTTILTQRFLALLARVDAPEEILAITFTRKAAAEMRGRILEALRACDGEPRNDAERLTFSLAAAARRHAGARGWGLQENPARLRVQTIDGLNRWLAANRPVTNATGASLDITAQPRRLYLDAARRTLLDAEADAQMQPHSGALLARLDNRWERLEALLADMLAHRLQWLRHLSSDSPGALRERVEASLDRLTLSVLRAAHDSLPASLRERGLQLAAHAALRLAEAGKPAASRYEAARSLRGSLTAEPVAAAAWQAVARLALTEKLALRATVDAKVGLAAKDGDHRAHALQWLDDLRAVPGAEQRLAAVVLLPPSRFGPVDAAALESLILLLRYASAQLEVLFRETGRVDYPAVAAAARESLGAGGEASELAIFQGERLRHLLIDEFQDTSIDQFELVESMVGDWEPGDGRTLFIVGDPMQSIYQFRQAEVGLFLRARDAGIARVRLDALALTRNFRSAAQVIDFVNATFATVFPAIDDLLEGAVRYLPCHAGRAREPAIPPEVTLHHVPDDGGVAEAAAVEAIVRRVRERRADASIAVLVAARDHAVLLARGLRAQGFRVQGVDLVPLAEVTVVQDLIALTRALGSLADRTAWLSLLRAPWCGLTLDAMTRLTARDPLRSIASLLADEDALAALDADDRRRVERLRAALPDEASQAVLAPLATRVEAAWLKLGGPSVCTGDSDLLDAQRYLEALAALEDSGEWRGPADLEWLVDGLYAASDGAAADAVQVMTIHRSKGLEFDCVILPGLGRTPRGEQEPLLDWFEWPGDDGNEELVLAPVRSADAEDRSALGAWIDGCRKRRRDRERARVLYVATTRARCALHLIGSVPQDGQGANAAPKRTAPLGTLWPAIGGHFPALASSPATAPANEGAQRDLRRVPLDWQPPDPPPDVEFSSVAVSTVEAAEVPTYIWVSETARRIGNVVHAQFERYVRDGQLPSPGELAAARPQLRQLLEGEGVEVDELPQALQRVLEALSRAVQDPVGRWLLDVHPAENHVELQLTGLSGGRLTSVVIDRCFVGADGVRWIVDYKTSAHEGGGIDEFLASEAARYRPQLLRYAALARGLGPQPVRAALYFPLLARLVEIALD